MWQCTFCYYTSIKKFNVQAHEKRMHSNYNEKTILKNNQNNNEEIKIEEGNIEHVKYNPSIKDEYKVLEWDKIQSRENDVDNMKVLQKIVDWKQRGKKISTLQMKMKQKRQIVEIEESCRNLSKVIKEYRKLYKIKKDWLSDE